jgi:hypothetical protein
MSINWNNVKESLPKEKGWYLVTLKYGPDIDPVVSTLMFIPHYNKHDDPNENVDIPHGESIKEGDPVWYDHGCCEDEYGCIPDDIYTDYVIAWSEKPEPYKGG